MNGICKPENVMENFGNRCVGCQHLRVNEVRLISSGRELYIVERREVMVAEAVGSWEFSAHEFSDDELQYAAFLMLQHALGMPELEKWRLSTGVMTSYQSMQGPEN